MTPWLLGCCLLYTLAVIVLFVPALHRDRPWLGHGLFSAAILMSLVSGALSWLGLGWLALLAGGIYLFHRPATAPWLKVVALLIVVFTTLGLAAHVMPGFANPALTIDTAGHEGRLHYINLDKALAGYLLLALWVLRSPRALEGSLLKAGSVLLVTPLLVFPMAIGFGLVSFEPKFPDYTVAWAWSNLFITCVTEEAFFRGVIQQQLVLRMGRYRFGVAAALVVTSLLFGLAHFGGGAAFVIVAAVAGLGYGLVYHFSRRIELAILLHFSINLIHFLLFTYPAR